MGSVKNADSGACVFYNPVGDYTLFPVTSKDYCQGQLAMTPAFANMDTAKNFLQSIHDMAVKKMFVKSLSRINLRHG